MGTRGGGDAAVATELRLGLTADPALLAPVRRAVRRWAEQNGIAQDRLERLLLACGEALANSMEHAAGTPVRRPVPAEPGGHGGPGGDPITLTVRLDPEGRMVAQIWDRGPWRLSEQGTAAVPLRGRGLALMRRVMGRVRVDRAPTGTVVTLVE